MWCSDTFSSLRGDYSNYLHASNFVSVLWATFKCQTSSVLSCLLWTSYLSSELFTWSHGQMDRLGGDKEQESVMHWNVCGVFLSLKRQNDAKPLTRACGHHRLRGKPPQREGTDSGFVNIPILNLMYWQMLLVFSFSLYHMQNYFSSSQ